MLKFVFENFIAKGYLPEKIGILISQKKMGKLI